MFVPNSVGIIILLRVVCFVCGLFLSALRAGITCPQLFTLTLQSHLAGCHPLPLCVPPVQATAFVLPQQHYCSTSTVLKIE